MSEAERWQLVMVIARLSKLRDWGVDPVVAGQVVLGHNFRYYSSVKDVIDIEAHHGNMAWRPEARLLPQPHGGGRVARYAAYKAIAAKGRGTCCYLPAPRLYTVSAATPRCRDHCTLRLLCIVRCEELMQTFMYVIPIPAGSVRHMHLVLEDMLHIYHCDAADVAAGQWVGYDPRYGVVGGGGGGGDSDDGDGGDDDDDGDGIGGVGTASSKSGTKKRKRAGGDASSGSGRKCSSCGKVGHNKTSCGKRQDATAAVSASAAATLPAPTAKGGAGSGRGRGVRKVSRHGRNDNSTAAATAVAAVRDTARDAMRVVSKTARDAVNAVRDVARGVVAAASVECDGDGDDDDGDGDGGGDGGGDYEDAAV
jgi:hypothetical protein